MTIQRIKREKTESFVVIANAIFKNPEASLKVRGLFATIMALPDSWDFSVKGIVSILPEGRDAVMGAIRELVKLGYVKIEKTRNEKGRITGVDYVFFETPCPGTGFPFTGNPFTDNPATDNPHQYNKKLIKEERIKEERKESSLTARAVAVFEHWKKTMNKPRAVFDDKRKASVIARLKNGYTVTDLLQAVEGCAASSFHMGDNDRKTKYDALTLICKDAEHVDRFMEIAEQSAGRREADAKQSVIMACSLCDDQGFVLNSVERCKHEHA